MSDFNGNDGVSNEVLKAAVKAKAHEFKEKVMGNKIWAGVVVILGVACLYFMYNSSPRTPIIPTPAPMVMGAQYTPASYAPPSAPAIAAPSAPQPIRFTIQGGTRFPTGRVLLNDKSDFRDPSNVTLVIEQGGAMEPKSLIGKVVEAQAVQSSYKGKVQWVAVPGSVIVK